jgi:hypothetical protein
MRVLGGASGSPSTALRGEILLFLGEMFGAENCPYLRDKRTVDHYVRFHFLAFVKLYVPSKAAFEQKVR